MIPLTKDEKRVLKIMEAETTPASVGDLEPKVTFMSDRWLRKTLDKLAQFGFLAKTSEERVTSKKPVMVYSYLTQGKISIPEFKDIENCSNDSFNSTDSNNSTDSFDIKKKEHVNQINHAKAWGFFTLQRGGW